MQNPAQPAFVVTAKDSRLASTTPITSDKIDFRIIVPLSAVTSNVEQLFRYVRIASGRWSFNVVTRDVDFCTGRLNIAANPVVVANPFRAKAEATCICDSCYRQDHGKNDPDQRGQD